MAQLTRVLGWLGRDGACVAQVEVDPLQLDGVPEPIPGAGVDGVREEVGVIDTDCFVAFLWTHSGRPSEASVGWRRERPLYIVPDNYSLHHSQQVKGARPLLKAAQANLVYLPAYTPELSDIEPVWHEVKHYHLPKRSHARVGELKRTAEAGLASKAQGLRHAYPETAHSPCKAA